MMPGKDAVRVKFGDGRFSPFETLVLIDGNTVLRSDKEVGSVTTVPIKAARSSVVIDAREHA